jgi:hypothetical protein
MPASLSISKVGKDIDVCPHAPDLPVFAYDFMSVLSLDKKAETIGVALGPLV